jgi:hypothetical protein
VADDFGFPSQFSEKITAKAPLADDVAKVNGIQ